MMLQLRTPSLTGFAILTIVINAILPGVPVHSEESDQFYKLPDLKIVEDKFDTSRLMDLLRLKQTLTGDYPAHFGILESQQQHDSTETGDGADVSKRVFCNGFTGCGGRFRGRRRQQQTETENLRKRRFPYALDKRPFCNQVGCFNGGRKRSADPIEGQVVNSVSTDSGFYDLPAKVKKLFCNGYGGCQNLGKRDSGLNSSVEAEEGKLSPKRIRSLIRLAEAKRFFAGGYDKAMNGLIKSARK